MSPRPSRLIFCAGNYSIEYLKATTLLLEELAELNDYHCIQEYAAKVLQKIQGNVDIYYWLILAEERMGAKDTALKDEYSARQNLTDEEYRELEAEPES